MDDRQDEVGGVLSAERRTTSRHSKIAPPHPSGSFDSREGSRVFRLLVLNVGKEEAMKTRSTRLGRRVDVLALRLRYPLPEHSVRTRGASCSEGLVAAAR